jgi:hypothetical protein
MLPGALGFGLLFSNAFKLAQLCQKKKKSNQSLGMRNKNTHSISADPAVIFHALNFGELGIKVIDLESDHIPESRKILTRCLERLSVRLILQ